jgi:hypothetical protein
MPQEDDFADIEAANAKLPSVDIAAMLRAQREAEQAPWPPPSIIPQPEFVRVGPFESLARFHCPLGCGWWHDENPDGDMWPLTIVVPADPTPEDFSAAISAQAAARGERLRARVDKAITDHYDETHPER